MPSEAVERVLRALEALDCNPRGNDQKGWDACCPSHDDRDPSFHLGEGADGKALVTCFAGCTLDQIAAALELDVRDLFEPEPEPVVPRRVVERYDYTDEHGGLLFQVERLEPKGFRQRRPDGNGGWEYRLGDVRRVLYRLPRVIDAVRKSRLVCVVEGERDVHTLERKGKIATTCPGGAGKWREEYSQTLSGARVAVIQDVDALDPRTGKRAGQEHAQAVCESLRRAGARMVKLLEPAVGKDVTEHVDAGVPLKELVSCEPPPETPKPKARLEVMAAPDVMRLPDPDKAGNFLGPLIYKGYRIVVGGHTGHGKTTFTMHMTAAAVRGEDFLDPHWHGKGNLRALIIDVEQGVKSVKRVLREVGLEDDPNVHYLRVPDGLALDTDRDAITSMERIFHAGRYDIVVADPLYKLHRGDPNDTKAATDLMCRFDDWRDRYSFSLILPMHCRKANGIGALTPHDLFGSSAYQWGAEVLLGLERPRKAEDGAYSRLHFWKDRDGEITEIAPLNGEWGLMFERGHGFRKAGKPKPVHARDVIYGLLREHTGGLTIDEIEELWPGGRLKAPNRNPTLYNALASIPGVTHDGHAGKGARVWQLPASLFNGNAPG